MDSYSLTSFINQGGRRPAITGAGGGAGQGPLYDLTTRLNHGIMKRSSDSHSTALDDFSGKLEGIETRSRWAGSRKQTPNNQTLNQIALCIDPWPTNGWKCVCLLWKFFPDTMELLHAARASQLLSREIIIQCEISKKVPYFHRATPSPASSIHVWSWFLYLIHRLYVFWSPTLH